MKRTLPILLVICMLLLSGCQSSVFQVFQKPNTSKGSSPDNLVPLGEYVDICPDKRDVQVCISEIITGDKAKELVGDKSHDYVIIKFNMKAVNLNGKEFNPPSSMKMVLNDGTIAQDTYTYDADENLGLSQFGIKTFGAEGSIDCISVFSARLDQCQYLKYGNRSYENETYFAIRE